MNEQRELSPILALACAGAGVVLVVAGAALVAWQLGVIALGLCLLAVALLGVE